MLILQMVYVFNFNKEKLKLKTFEILSPICITKTKISLSVFYVLTNEWCQNMYISIQVETVVIRPGIIHLYLDERCCHGFIVSVVKPVCVQSFTHANKTQLNTII